MTIVPFNYYKLSNDSWLVSNITQDFIVLNSKEFEALKTLNSIFFTDDLKDKLLRYRFVYESEEQLNNIVKMYRKENSGLFRRTQLHIFILTLECNLACRYCQAAIDDRSKSLVMSSDVALKALEIAFSVPEDDIFIEFQGGEPLKNFDTLKYIVRHGKIIANKNAKRVNFSIVTNASLMTNEILKFLMDNEVRLSFSFDGLKTIHDSNRPAKDRTSNYDDVIRWYKEATKRVTVSLIATTTRAFLTKYKEIIDEFIKLGQYSIFIRPLSPFGRIANSQDMLYSAEEFIEYYQNSINYILELNIEKKIYISEFFTSIIVEKIIAKESVNYVDLRSPCGAAVGQIAYNYDGKIYTCDEGRMMSNIGIDDFCIGNVSTSTYSDCLLCDNACQTVCASCTDSNPYCSTCVFSQICGLCPVYSWQTQNDLIGKPWKQDRCKILKGIYLFIIDKFINGTSDEKEVLKKWAK